MLALEWLKQSPNPATIYSDSMLVVEQMNGRWKVKAEGLRGMFLEAKSLLKSLPPVKIVSILRNKNRNADTLANRALDENRIISDSEFRGVIDEFLSISPTQSSLF